MPIENLHFRNAAAQKLWQRLHSGGWLTQVNFLDTAQKRTMTTLKSDVWIVTGKDSDTSLSRAIHDGTY